MWSILCETCISHFKSLEKPQMDQEQCCMDNHVSQECLVLCRQDPNYADYSSDDTMFPNDTPCEKHKSAINRCWANRGTYNFYVMYLRAILQPYAL